MRPELLKCLQLQDRAKLSQVSVVAHRELKPDIASAAAHASQLLEGEKLRQEDDRHIEALVLEEKFLFSIAWSSDW